LAKSTKRNGYCIAGVDTTTGEWIRPISSNITNEGAVPLNDIIYEDGNAVQILDKVKIKLLSHNPTKSQPENYIYDPEVSWRKTGVSSLDKVIAFRGYDEVEKIFYNSSKEVSERELNGQASLLLVNVIDSHIYIKTFEDGNRKTQFNFEYNNIKYSYFKVSDEVIKSALANKPDDRYYQSENLSVVFSLTDKYEKTGKYYKMVAQMFY
jgi:hypothetical protein